MPTATDKLLIKIRDRLRSVRADLRVIKNRDPILFREVQEDLEILLNEMMGEKEYEAARPEPHLPTIYG